MGLFASIAGAVAGPLIGGLLSNRGSKNRQRDVERAGVASNQRQRTWILQDQARQRQLELQDRSYSEGRESLATSPEQGQRLGQHAESFYDSAFPGTTPWERLGTSNPSGQVSVAEAANSGRVQQASMAARVALRSDQIRSRTAIEVAQIQSRAQIAAAAGNNQASYVSAGINTFARERIAAKDQAIRSREAAVKERVGTAQVAHLNADTILKSKVMVTEAHRANLTEAQVREVVSRINNLDADTILKGKKVLHTVEQITQTHTNAEIQKVLLAYKDWLIAANLAGAGGIAASSFAKVIKSVGPAAKGAASGAIQGAKSSASFLSNLFKRVF